MQFQKKIGTCKLVNSEKLPKKKGCGILKQDDSCNHKSVFSRLEGKVFEIGLWWFISRCCTIYGVIAIQFLK